MAIRSYAVADTHSAESKTKKKTSQPESLSSLLSMKESHERNEKCLGNFAWLAGRSDAEILQELSGQTGLDLWAAWQEVAANLYAIGDSIEEIEEETGQLLADLREDHDEKVKALEERIDNAKVCLENGIAELKKV